MPQDIAKAEPPAAAKSDEQQTEPVASSEITVDHQSGSELTMVAKAEVEVKLEAAAEPKPEPLAKAVDSHPAPEPETLSSPAGPVASQQESTVGKKEVTVAPGAENAPDPTAEPQATTAPVAKEPMAEVGHQVGNRIPDFTLDLVGGATVSTINLVEEGKPTFLFFTSTT
jgi:hypothetical protein